ncbi:glycosyltransferase family 10 domain-containing protein [Prosthecomicrobium pneumaticum]|uniref:Fucosyltransferase C-terminal domain-containing protein n=1 Tax=Prosthecomicrobium pneumaticum TaxID=81895 RepID=A0A7W9FQ78_9HYPH|nr:glycosyltransferase family 10 [Prosthecomicrobium pneumaticum]MBB5754814.1 hypothetical protein [Prosthecomicrobium pneumaticum]
MPIRVFRANPIAHGVFGEGKVHRELTEAGITVVPDVEDADIVLSDNPKWLDRYKTLPRRFAVYTYEPRFCTEHRPIVWREGFSSPIHVMDVYTRDVFIDQFLYMGTGAAEPEIALDTLMARFSAKPKNTAAMLAGYRAATEILIAGLPRTKGPVDIDLCALRQDIARAMKAGAGIDIFGRKWPDGLASGEHRAGPWHAVKLDLLANYQINVCLENTRYPFYVSEKLWDATQAGCLPVYHGADNHIYEVFPRDSFFEVAGQTPEQVAAALAAMPDDERADRYERCAQTLVRVNRDRPGPVSRAALRVRVARFIERVMETPLFGGAEPASGPAAASAGAA